MSRGALQKLQRRSMYKKRTKAVFCTSSTKGSKSRSSCFKRKISLICFSRGSCPPLKSAYDIHVKTFYKDPRIFLDSRIWLMNFPRCPEKRISRFRCQIRGYYTFLFFIFRFLRRLSLSDEEAVRKMLSWPTMAT